MPRKSANALAEAKIVRHIPSTDRGTGVICTAKSGQRYRISQNPDKGKHTLWKVVDGGYEKVATADSPYDLYELIDWE